MGGENVPGIPRACATCNFTYLVRGPCPKSGTVNTGLMRYSILSPASRTQIVMPANYICFFDVTIRTSFSTTWRKTLAYTLQLQRLWTHQQVAHEISADSSSFGACVSTCSGSSDGQGCVWDFGQNVLGDIQLLLNIFWQCRQKHGVQFILSAPSWSWTLRENPLIVTGKGTVFFSATQLNLYQRLCLQAKNNSLHFYILHIHGYDIVVIMFTAN